MNKRGLAVVWIACAVSLTSTGLVRAQGEDRYEIVQVQDGVYSAAAYSPRSGSHRTVFLVTEDGIVLADPISVSFSEWLKSEIDERFGVPVRYVLYSHHHWDHASGGAVFADTATFVSHEGMATALAAPLPANLRSRDANGNGLLHRSEATRGYAARFDDVDVNRDDNLSGAEINVDIRPPDLLYSERMTVALGGQSVWLLHPNPAHSDDMTVLYFPQQRVGFAVDFANVRLMPGELYHYSLDHYESAVETVLALDIDHFVPGHGEVGDGEDLADYLVFLQDLQRDVSAAIENGLTEQQAEESVQLAEYSDWQLYGERRPGVVTSAYSILMNTP
ncbi:MAG: MBL fold metallo-hydrolase [Candidatus Rariloculaceae bacterium]